MRSGAPGLTRREFLGGSAAGATLFALGPCVPPSPPTPGYVPPATGTWETVLPADVGWDAGLLVAAVDFAVRTNARSMVVLGGGRIVAEYHATDAAYERDIASAQKSIVSMLVGRAAHEGLLALDDPVSRHLGAGWTASASETSITVRHLLTMTSGLNDALRVATTPGTSWYYNNSAYMQVQVLLEAVTGTGLDELARTWLFDPVGASGAAFVPRLRTDPLGRRELGLVGSARDLARLGLLVQRGGRWGEQQVHPATDELAESLAPSTALNPSYGHLWWLNGQSGYRLPGPVPPLQPGPLVPSAPADLVAALGAADQKCYVVPSIDCVVTRLGDQAYDQRAALSGFDDDLWAALSAARL